MGINIGDTLLLEGDCIHNPQWYAVSPLVADVIDVFVHKSSDRRLVIVQLDKKISYTAYFFRSDHPDTVKGRWLILCLSDDEAEWEDTGYVRISLHAARPWFTSPRFPSGMTFWITTATSYTKL